MLKTYSPFVLQGLKLKNRLVMPGMTRCRAEVANGNPTDLMKAYYSQRADSAGLIISEYLPVSYLANAWPGSGALWTSENAKKWKPITDAVQAKNTRFFAQLGHAGRVTHSAFVNGQVPIAPSAIAAPGETFTPSGKQPFSIPKAATQEELDQIKREHVTSALHAKEAGFDGIEIGAATGLLLDQFLKTSSNQRIDKYGGSIENRARYLFEIYDAVTAIFPANRIGVKLSPVTRAFGMFTENPKEDLIYLLKELEKRGTLWVNLVEPENQFGDKDGSKQIPEVAEAARKTYKGIIMTNGYKALAERVQMVESGVADLAAVARYHAANPDLKDRLEKKQQLNEFKAEFAYTGGDKGYIDYPYATPKSINSDKTGL